MWDRFRQKDGTAPPLSRKKLEAWQNKHSSLSSPRGVKGGNSQYQYAVKGGPAPSKPPRAFNYLPENAQQQQRQQQGQQQIQQNPGYLTAPPTGRYAQRDSNYDRPVSSVYSQPSPEAAVFAAQQLRNDMAHSNPLEISPPSSPDVASPREGPFPGDVSPIDEPSGSFHVAQEPHAIPPPRTETRTEPRSNIPMMRRERRKNSDAAAMNTLRESRSRDRTTPPRPYGNDVRWDPRTGEPTTSAKGRPSQVNPQEYVHGLVNRNTTSPSPQSKPSPPNPASFRDNLRPLREAGVASPQPEPALRPEWRGASGRAPRVAPVRDNQLVAPLKIPNKSSKRGGRNLVVLSPIESNGSEAASSPRENAARSPPAPEQHKGSMFQPTSNLVQQPQSPDTFSNSQSSPQASAYPTPPLSENVIRANRPRLHEQTAGTPSQPPPLQIRSNEKAIRRKPARLSDHHAEPSTPSRYSQHDAPTPQASTSGPPDEWTQPPSRFSITTYATSNHTSTPRMSVDEDAPPLPSPPQSSTTTPVSKPTQEVSVLERGRPTISGYEDAPRKTPTEPVKIVLDSPYYAPSPTTTAATKPWSSGPQTRATVVPAGNHSRLSVASISSAEKELPPAPPEASAKDRVDGLNAQLEALANRRININTAIRQMTEMMPTDNILASEAVVRKREQEKRKVEMLRNELAGVERQSYELGLKLHRAYKRLDRDAVYEPTTLWVRRVTN